jgi:hypothetical protein
MIDPSCPSLPIPVRETVELTIQGALWLFVLIAGGAFLFGYNFADRAADWYWAHHGDHGGSVHYRGRFYKVLREGESEADQTKRVVSSWYSKESENG